MSILNYFNVSKTTINMLRRLKDTYEKDGSRSQIRDFVKKLKRYDFECIRDFCQMVERRNNCCIFKLPRHIQEKQIEALERVHGTKNLTTSAGKALVCLQCKQFKGFIAHKVNNKRVNLYAYGQSKVLVDYNTCKLYCGKRSDKVDGKKRNNYSLEMESIWNSDQKEQDLRNKKRKAKDIRKENYNKICSNTELVKVNLIGYIFLFYGSMYTVCPECGNFMKYSPKNISKHGLY